MCLGMINDSMTATAELECWSVSILCLVLFSMTLLYPISSTRRSSAGKMSFTSSRRSVTQTCKCLCTCHLSMSINELH